MRPTHTETLLALAELHEKLPLLGARAAAARATSRALRGETRPERHRVDGSAAAPSLNRRLRLAESAEAARAQAAEVTVTAR